METEDAPQRTGWVQATHSSALAAAITLLGAAVAFDVTSTRADDQFIYARGAFTLTKLGLAVGILAVVLLVVELASWPQGGTRRQGLVHLAAMDVTILWFALRYLDRRSAPLVPSGDLLILVSAMVIAASGVTHLWYLMHVRPGSRPGERVGAT